MIWSGAGCLFQREIAGQSLTRHAQFQIRSFETEIWHSRHANVDRVRADFELFRDLRVRVVQKQIQFAAELQSRASAQRHIATDFATQARRIDTEESMAVAEANNVCRASF